MSKGVAGQPALWTLQYLCLIKQESGRPVFIQLIYRSPILCIRRKGSIANPLPWNISWPMQDAHKVLAESMFLTKAWRWLKQCYLSDRCIHLMTSFLLYVQLELDTENKTRSSRAEHVIRVLGSQGWWAETSKGQQIFCVICVFSMPSRGFCIQSVLKEYLLTDLMNILCAAGRNQELRLGKDNEELTQERNSLPGEGLSKQTWL